MSRVLIGLAVGFFCAAVFCAAVLRTTAAYGAEEGPAAEKAAGATDAALFDRLDANHDGQLTREETADDKRELFDRLLKQADGDKNGRLSRDEFLAGLKSRRPKRADDEKLPADFGGLPSQEAMEDIFRRLDRNQDGKVAADEVPDEARERFDRLAAVADTDGDRSISKEEFEKGIEKIRRPFAGRTDLEPQEIFEQLDRDADGKLTLDEIPSDRVERFKRGLQFGDRDKDGALSLEEFTRVVTAHRKLEKQMESVAGSDSPSAAPQDSASSKSSARKGKGKGKGKGSDRLAKLDSDHDGKVSLAEYTNREKNRFNRLDKNQDGFLDRDEIRQAKNERTVKTGVRAADDAMERPR